MKHTQGTTIEVAPTEPFQVIEASDGRISLLIHIQLKQRSGRRLMVLPRDQQAPQRPWDGSLTPLQQALVRGHRWLKMLESGTVQSVTELSQQLGIDNSYIGRMLNLTTLAPDIIAAILDDRMPSHVKLMDLAVNPPVVWEEQRCQYQ